KVFRSSLVVIVNNRRKRRNQWTARTFVNGIAFTGDCRPSDRVYDGPMKVLGSCAALSLASLVTAEEFDPGALALKVMQVNGNGSIHAREVAADANNRVYVCGGFQGRKPFGTNILTTLSRYDAFVARYDSP